jgi:hypothetical protein
VLFRSDVDLLCLVVRHFEVSDRFSQIFTHLRKLAGHCHSKFKFNSGEEKKMIFKRIGIDFRPKMAVWFLLLFSILTFQVNRSLGADVTPGDKKAYLEALRSTEEATQEKVFTRLLAVVPDWDPLNHERLYGSSIRWEGEPGHSRVLVATFFDRGTYVKYYKTNLDNHEEEYILNKSLWVTVVPELKNFFIRRNFYNRCPPSCKRVKQLLGLHPANDYDVVLEMWVNSKDLFRPSPDPEITDHEAQVATKISQDHWIFPYDLNPFLKIDDTVLFKEAQWSPTAVPYKTWFINRAQTVYVNGPVLNEDDPNTWGYPWTQLGYSYDWGNPKDHMGLSEFILRIDPNKNGGEVTIKLERAYDCETRDWPAYFRCHLEVMHGDGVVGGDAEEFDASTEDLN